MKYLFLATAFFVLVGCQSEKSTGETDQPTQVELQTNFGKIVIQLYDETPLHKANFIKLVGEGAYDSLLFHRVIEGFVVQGGDPDSKYASPERESNAMQFYIVQAGPVADSIINQSEERINQWLSVYHTLHAPENKVWLDSINWSMENEEWQTYRRISDTVATISESFIDFDPYKIPEEHREVYRTMGGTPMLDQNYTVFAEVISGMDVVDSIAAVSTNDLDRPIDEVRIISAKIIEK